MDTKTAAEKWGCKDRDVQNWCRSGFVDGAVMEKRKWLIPDDAQRPLDRKLQKEILWQILQWKDSHQKRVDLTCGGISDDGIVNYIALLLGAYLRNAPGVAEIRDLDDLELTERGFSLLGYGKEAEAESLPKVIRWSASAAGVFAANFASESLRQLAGLS